MPAPARTLALIHPDADPSPDWTLDRYIRWCLDGGRTDIKPRTRRNMRYMLTPDKLGRIASQPIGEIRTADVQATVNALSDRYCDGSVKTVAMMLSGTLHYAVDNGVIASNPVSGCRVRSPEPTEHTILSPAQLMRLAWVAIDARPVSSSAAVVVAMLGCGLRICEARGPRARDLVLDGEHPQWRVEWQAAPYVGADGPERRRPKSKQGMRVVPALPEVVTAVRLHWSEVFGRDPQGDEWALGITPRLPVSCAKVTGDLRALCRLAELPSVTPHELRHAWATAHAEAGMSVARLAKMLGTTVAIALRYYIHVVDDTSWGAVDRTFAAARA